MRPVVIFSMALVGALPRLPEPENLYRPLDYLCHFTEGIAVVWRGVAGPTSGLLGLAYVCQVSWLYYPRSFSSHCKARVDAGF